MTEELPPPFSTPLPEDIGARLELFQERARAFHDLVAKRAAAAEARGRQLLLALLDDQQREELTEHGSFLVTGSEGGIFRICEDTNSGNVLLIRPDSITRGKPRDEVHLLSFCAHFDVEPDEFLVPYVKTLRNTRGGYCCLMCNGESPQEYYTRRGGRADEQYWSEGEARNATVRMLCQSDLMIGQMFKIKADELGWILVAVACTRNDPEAAGRYMQEMERLRQVRAAIKVAERRVAEGETMLADGRQVIISVPHRRRGNVARTLVYTDGTWQEAPQPEAPPRSAVEVALNERQFALYRAITGTTGAEEIDLGRAAANVRINIEAAGAVAAQTEVQAAIDRLAAAAYQRVRIADPW